MVVSELRGEKIDIIPYNEEPARFVAKALSPARVREVLVDDEDRQATVIVPDDQLSLAIGREGQNARLAAKLTGWRVDIVGESEFAERGEDEGFEDEEEQATAAAPPCSPPAAAARTPPCRAPASAACRPHQALARFATNQVTVLCRSARGRSRCSPIGAADDLVAPIVARAEAAFAEPSRRPPRTSRRGRGARVADEVVAPRPTGRGAPSAEAAEPTPRMPRSVAEAPSRTEAAGRRGRSRPPRTPPVAESEELAEAAVEAETRRRVRRLSRGP